MNRPAPAGRFAVTGNGRPPGPGEPVSLGSPGEPGEPVGPGEPGEPGEPDQKPHKLSLTAKP
ncbi:MAG: hypothetical protein DLM62_18765 [Pseudonocardiales bacterium]|nr:MAG: hypothetical protein DLM62_18765 [Pseudonocardiales bacterium]